MARRAQSHLLTLKQLAASTTARAGDQAGNEKLVGQSRMKGSGDRTPDLLRNEAPFWVSVTQLFTQIFIEFT